MIEKEKLHSALRQMGKKGLKPQYRDRWTPERPTTGYCYVVTDVIFHYLAPEGSKPYVVRMNGDTHYYLKLPNGEIVDDTSDQYDEPVPYEKGKPYPFPKKISPRGKKLAELLGLI